MVARMDDFKGRTNIIEVIVVQIGLNYREPLELLSCFCCILGDNVIDQCSTEDLYSARDAISKQRQQMREASASEDEGHPALIVQKAFAFHAQG